MLYALAFSLSSLPANTSSIKAQAYQGIGQVHKSSGQLELAITQFKNAVNAAPDSKWPHIHLADALGEQGSLQEAAEEYGRALAIDPDDVWVRDALQDIGTSIPGGSP